MHPPALNRNKKLLPSKLTYSNVACTICGCVCDDLEVTISEQRVVAVSPPCSLAEPWWLQQNGLDQPKARIGNNTVSVERAIEHTAELLENARSPLIYGLSRSSTPGQRAAVRLADHIGATIDTTASTCHAPSIMALQSVGESTASLGEISNRSDLIVYWGSNPLKSHPRHMERCVDAAGLQTPKGRADRHVVVVDAEQTETTGVADTFVQVAPGRDFELIWALRGLLKGLTIDELPACGLDRAEIVRLCDLLKSCNYGVIFFGLGLTKHGVPHANVEALLTLVTDLNAYARFTARRMRIPGDVAGADSVLCWQTGFPFSVSLTRGYPRFSPGEYTANNMLERGEVDAILLVGSEGVGKLSKQAQQHIKRIPVIVLDYPNQTCPIGSTVQFTTAIYGVHERGTAYRMDEVPIPLRKMIDSNLPSDHWILSEIMKRCRRRVGG